MTSKYEILVIDDDSQDGSEAIVADLQKSFPVKILVRKGQRGLATAVITGISAAKGKFIVTMDADLSHPPEKIPEMFSLLNEDQSDFVLGSRYIGESKSVDGWNFYRHINSGVATILARPPDTV